MSEQPASATTAVSTADLLKLVTVYGVILAGLYLFAYWGAFNINILAFISLTDVFKVTAYPLVVSLGSLILGAALGGVLRMEKALPAGAGKQTRAGRLLNRYKSQLEVLYYLAIVLLAFFGQTPLKWTAVGMMIGIAVAQYTAETPILSRLFPSRQARTIAVTLMAASLGGAFGHGQMHAERARAGIGVMTVDGRRSNLPLHETPEKPAILLGFLGERYFIYERATGSVIIVKPKDDASIVLATFSPEPAVGKPSQSTPISPTTSSPRATPAASTPPAALP